ncbi:type II toxin-antitoxin system HicB family antitoxin [Paludibaculum fermentans]|uniref:type II toxin-antitoxin system HicB family antitoxin n=1 Tax=Paludibaculum fermentans TaxID=1473598 RepID=UPI003EBCECAB
MRRGRSGCSGRRGEFPGPGEGVATWLSSTSLWLNRGERNLSAYFPDLPGCIATGDDMEELKANLAVALQWHLEALREDGVEPPAPTAQIITVQVA